jgi:hypothetical protein
MNSTLSSVLQTKGLEQNEDCVLLLIVVDCDCEFQLSNDAVASSRLQQFSPFSAVFE